MGTWAQDIAINTLWYNNTAGEDPTEGTIPTNVANGAVAVNTNDGRMWVRITNGDLSGWEAISGVNNPLLVATGGTGVQTITQNGVLIGNGTDPVTAVDMSTKGHLLAGDGTGNPRTLAVGGTEGQVLTVRSATSTGLRWDAPAAGHNHSGSTDETFQDIFVQNIYDKDSAVSGTYLNKIELGHSVQNFYVSENINGTNGTVHVAQFAAYFSGNYGSQVTYGHMGIGTSASNSYSLLIYGGSAPLPTKQADNTAEWSTSSDERLKTNAVSLTGATAKIKALNPVNYQWSAAYREATGLSNSTHVGYLANEYATVFPTDVTATNQDLIRLNDGSYATGEYSPKVPSSQEALPSGATVSVADMKVLNSASVVPYLVAAFKELEARVIALES